MPTVSLPRRLILAVVFGAAAGLASPVSAQALAKPPVVVIQHVTIVPMTAGGAPLPDATVVIRDGRIAALGPSREVAAPAGATRVDGRGKWLMPGLADMHVHVENWRLMRGYLGDPAITPATVRTEDILTPYVASGVLQIMNMGADPVSIGQRDEVASGEVLGPRMALAAMVDGSPPLQSPAMTRVAANPQDGRQIVRDIKWDGYDAVKVYGNLDLETYRAILDEAGKQKIKVLGHIPGLGKIPIEQILVPGFSMVAHAEEFTREGMKDEDIARYVDVAKRNGTWLTSTLALDERILAQTRDPSMLSKLPGLPYLHPVTRPVWFELNRYFGRGTPERIANLERQVSYTKRLTKAFVDAGIPVVAGTDSLVPGMSAGFGLHDELEALVRAGLTNEQTLAAATRVPAEWLGVQADRGTVEAGKQADLLLLDADPLANVANTRRISGVIVAGRYLPRAELDRMMKALATRYAAMPPFKAPPRPAPPAPRPAGD